MNEGDRAGWLAERRKGVGSSDAAAIVGLSPWRSPWEIYQDKIGELPEIAPTKEMEWGLRLEGAIAAAYSELTGQDLSAPTIMRHPKYPWMLASIDRISEAGRIVELKAASPFQRDQWGEPWSDQVPEQYLVQVQHQMAVAGLDVADIAVLLGLFDFKVYTVRRNDQLLADLVELEWQFWQRVQERRPPEPDWGNTRTQEILRKIRPTPGKEIEINEPEFAEILCSFLAEQRQEKEASEAKEKFKTMLLSRMGEAAAAIFPDGRRLERRVINRQGYTVKPCEFVNFRVKEPK